jgi:hypothetical protein
MQKPNADSPQPATLQDSARPATNAEVKMEAPKAIATPVSNALKPDKSIEVPKYAVCMAGDATPIEGVIHAVTPQKSSE